MDRRVVLGRKGVKEEGVKDKPCSPNPGHLVWPGSDCIQEYRSIFAHFCSNIYIFEKSSIKMDACRIVNRLDLKSNGHRPPVRTLSVRFFFFFNSSRCHSNGRTDGYARRNRW